MVALELDPQRLGNRLACEVVLGRAEASHKDDEVGALDRGACDGSQLQPVIANNGLEGDINADVVELAGEVEGISVLPVRSEHLRADGHDFGDHG